MTTKPTPIRARTITRGSQPPDPSPVRRLSGSRPIGWFLALSLLGAIPIGRADAQGQIVQGPTVQGQTGGEVSQPMVAGQSPAPIPAVVYPTRDPDTRPPEGGPNVVAPRPVLSSNQGQPVQYYLVDGIWGYRDRDRRFHPAPADWRPPEHGLAVAHAHAGPRFATVLPNPAPRRIVTNQFMPLNRGRPR